MNLIFKIWFKLNIYLKRFIDIILSGISIIILLPFLIICGIIIKLDSKGPILFSQKRLTKNGRVFKMLKFRTMVVNAEYLGTGIFNFHNDPRVTRVGKLLRIYSIDELPQLFNVLIGDMSLIGPRPCVHNELGNYNTLNEKYKKRFELLAGISGMAQTQGRNDISWDIKVSFDNYYIDIFKKWGIIIDFKILIKTVVCILKKKNIYEHKIDISMSDIEAAELANQEIIKKAQEK